MRTRTHAYTSRALTAPTAPTRAPFREDAPLAAQPAACPELRLQRLSTACLSVRARALVGACVCARVLMHSCVCERSPACSCMSVLICSQAFRRPSAHASVPVCFHARAHERASVNVLARRCLESQLRV
eukprot:6184718-Pleurochrysis_carterae.AAC.1